MASRAETYEEQRMSIGSVFQRAFSTIGGNPGVVLILAVLLGGVPSALFSYVNRSMMAAELAQGGSMTGLWGAMLFSWVVSVVIAAIVQASLTRAVVAQSEGQRATLGECLAAAARVFLPLIAVGLIFALAIGAGFVLLFVPGIMIMIIWSVAAPALVVEREGVTAAFRRSSELTKGSRWKIFGLFLLLLVIYLVIFSALSVFGLKSMSRTGDFGVANLIISGVTAMAINLLWGTIQPSLYVELRRAQEGDSVDRLAEVFA